jgi:hypothetical protein
LDGRLGGPQSRFERGGEEENSLIVGNRTLDLRKIGYESVDWIKLAQDTIQFVTLVNTMVEIRVP